MKALDAMVTAPVSHGTRTVGFGSRTVPVARDARTVRQGARRRARVAGWGLVTPLGDAGQTWAALHAGQFIDDHAPARLPPGEDGVPRVSRLAISAARSACRGTTATDAGGDDAALVVGTSKGSVVEWLSGSPPGPEFLGDVAADVARDLRFGGPRLTVSAACASGLVALIRAAMMIESGEVGRAVVVAAEASLHPMFLSSFARLGVLPPKGYGCRPYDADRAGFLMSEAAAAVVLEGDACEAAFDTARATAGGGPAAVFVDGYAFGGDGTHLTGSDPDARLLRHLLARVIDGRPVDLVHGHGTGTPANDETELAAVEGCLAAQDTRPSLYSHKGALGHSLGAAGLLSVVLNCMAHAEGAVPPNARTRTPLPSRRVDLSPLPTRRAVRRSVAIAAGFGGATAVVSLASE